MNDIFRFFVRVIVIYNQWEDEVFSTVAELCTRFGHILIAVRCLASPLYWNLPLLLFQVEKPKPIKCGTFGATSLQQRHIATGDFEGNLNIWYFRRSFYSWCGRQQHLKPKKEKHCCMWSLGTWRYLTCRSTRLRPTRRFWIVLMAWAAWGLETVHLRSSLEAEMVRAAIWPDKADH